MVIDAEHIDTDEFTVCLIVVLAEIRNILGIHNSDSVCAFVVWFGNMQCVQQLLKCSKHGTLAVAASTA